MEDLVITKVNGPAKNDKRKALTHIPQTNKEDKSARVGRIAKGELTPLIVGRKRIIREVHGTILINLTHRKKLHKEIIITCCEYHQVHSHSTDEF